MAEMVQKLKSFFVQSKRVWMALKKPTKKEFEQVTKISAIGILILGFVGFFISNVMKAFI
jgi:protein transport protein SEC61 subunit gamma-like protein|tara:strand:+ start:7021 stop:7200 length:180 start_codon:yes stop_codon:yes gene_type:complete